MLTHILYYASITHMHIPDKPAFLAGSGRAMPFLSLPFCPGQMNDEMSERHVSSSDKTVIPQLNPSPTSMGNTGLLLTTN